MASTRASVARERTARMAGLLMLLVTVACETAEPGRALPRGHGAPDGIDSVVRGGLLAGEAARVLDPQDLVLVERAYLAGLETTAIGTASEWSNSESGHSGRLTPTRSYENARGRVCLEYLEAVAIDGRQRQAYGAACRQPDGRWTLVH